MKTTRIKARFVIGYEQGSHVIYHDGEVVYRGSEIVYVGKNYEGIVDQTIHAGLSIVAPGFIDLEADIDTDHALIDIAHPDDEQQRFIMGERYRIQDPYTEEDFEIRQRYSMAQLIRHGITTAMPIAGETFHGWSQSYQEHAIMAKVAIDMGMRLYVGPSFRSYTGVGTGYDHQRSERSLEEAFAHFETFDGSGGGLISGFVNPCQIRWTTLSVLQRALAFSRDKKAPMRLHACEGLAERSYIKRMGGSGTIDYFAQNRLLADNLLIPHAIIVSDRELELLARHQVSIISTPFAEAVWGDALFSFEKYKAYGINMTIGTDCQPVDMIRNIRMARDINEICRSRQISNRYHDDGHISNAMEDELVYPRLNVGDFFDAATVNAAKALHRNDIGRLEKGCKADIIIVNLDDIAVGPYEDPIRTLVMSCTGNNISHTIINGLMLMKDKQLVNIDEKALMRKAQATYERFLHLYEAYDSRQRPLHTLFPPTYPVK